MNVKNMKKIFNPIQNFI